MSIHNEEDFKIEQNKKKYLITLSIQEDQLFIGLTVLSNPPKKYSSYFSLNELRISSKIFDHTNTLFEAKEIIKRTVIKKQLLIDEDEHRARITFDTGLGHDSVPFPIILFRDSNDYSNNQNLENPKDNNRKIKNKNNDNNDNNNDSNTKKQNNDNIKGNKCEEENSQNINNNSNIQNLRPSIGNNINNKMLNNNNNSNNNNKMNLTNKKRDSNIQFNNSIKRANNKKSKISGKIVNDNNNNNTNNKKSNSGLTNKKDDSYKRVHLGNNAKNTNNNVNDGNAPRDYLTINNNLLHNIYNNMNNNNNINSSFYRNLQNSFTNDNIYDNITMNNNLNNNLINNIPITRLNIRNIDNNSINQTNLQQQQHNINIHKNINNNPMYINNNINKDKINTNFNTNANNNIQNPKNLENTKKLPYAKKTNSNNISNKASFVSQKYSSRTSDVRRQLTMKNLDNNTDIDTEKKTRNETNRENRSEKNDNDNDKKSLSLSMSENNDIMDENIDEFNLGDQPYRFKNLVIQGSKKIKGNLEKFKKNQNMGDYVPAGAKFVSYLKFPDTKKINSNLSMTASTISSSLTSGSNRIIGIEKNIIKNPSELDEITGRIQRILNKRNIKYKLLYKASEDGDLSTTFHTKCDNISNTLVLIQATKDKRFGGFTTQTWNGEDVNKKDKHCFIFSIDNMKVYGINKGEEAINCNPDLGPVFINQIKLLDKFFTQGGSTNKKGKTFETKEDFEINGGAEKFGVKEVEVYHVK